MQTETRPERCAVPRTRGLRTPRRAVAAIFVLNGGIFGIWASRIPAFVDRFALSPDMLGLLLLGLAGGAILSFPLAGRLSDRFGAASVTRTIAVFYTIALCLLAVAPTVPALALALVAFGIGHGALDVAMNAWAAEVERHLDRAIMSSFHAMFSLAAGLGAASGYIALNTGVTVAWHFPVAGLVLMAAALWMARLPWASLRTSHHGGSVFAIPKGALAPVGLIAFCAALGEGAMADWSAVFLDTLTPASEAQTALGYTVFSATMVLSRLSGDRVIQRIGPVRTARFSGLIAFGGICLAILSDTLAFGLLAFALMGIGLAVLIPIAFTRAAADQGATAGRNIASVATLAYGGMLLGPPVIGFLAQLLSLRAAFGVIALGAVMIVALAPSLRRIP